MTDTLRQLARATDTTLAGIYGERAPHTDAIHRAKVAMQRNETRQFRLVDAGKLGGALSEAKRDQAFDDSQAVYQGRIDAARVEIAKLDERAKPFEAIHAAHGWSRFFLVDNVGGHVHREMSCSTCFPTTVFGWLPELSAAGMAEMVDTWGQMACTVCFPDAPTLPRFSEPSRRDQASIAERAAVKAERAATKTRKAAEKIVRDARTAVVEGLWYAMELNADRDFGNPDVLRERVARGAAALEASGLTLEEANKKARAKWMRSKMHEFTAARFEGATDYPGFPWVDQTFEV